MKHMSHSVQASMTGLKLLASARRRVRRFSIIDQIEQAREGIAQIEAAPAAVADVEDAPQLGIELCRHHRNPDLRQAMGCLVGAARLPSLMIGSSG